MKEATDFDSTRKLGELLQTETHRLNKSFSSVIVRTCFRILNSRETECKLYGGSGTLTLEYSLGDQGVRFLNTV